MDKAQFRLLHNRKGQLNRDGKALVQIEAYLNAKKKYFSTNIYLAPSEWDRKKQLVKQAHPNAFGLNQHLKSFRDKMEKAELDRLNQGKPFTLEYLAEYLKGNVVSDFTQFFEKELDENRSLKPNTKKQHRTTFRKLKEFRSAIAFAELDFEMLQRFQQFMQDQELHPNTIDKHFRTIKAYVNRAIDREYMEQNRYPFRKFKTKTVQTQREFLTPEEIKRFEQLELPEEKSHLQKIQDMYLFSIYTGLRYGEIVQIKPHHLIRMGQETWLHVKEEKTEQQKRIPVDLLFDGKPLRMLQKYMVEGSDQLVFGNPANQYVNRCMKELAALAHIEKRITYHTSRHTCATFLLYKGVPLTTVQKVLGHTKIQTTQIYAKVMDATMKNDLRTAFGDAALTDTTAKEKSP